MPGQDHAWTCEVDGRMFFINRSYSFLKGMGAKSGHTRLQVSNAFRVPGTSDAPPTLNIASDVVPEIRMDDSNARRELLSTTGTFSTLVVRVSSNDGQPSRSAATFSADVFTDSLNFAKVMSDCSAAKATFVKATGTDIVDGVTELSISMNTAGVSSYTVEDAAVVALSGKFSSLSPFDTIILILPFNGAFLSIFNH